MTLPANAPDGTPPPEVPEEPGEDLRTLAVPFQGELGPLAIPVNGLLFLALVFSLYAGRAFLVPVTAAILMNFLLTPAVRVLGRIGIPQGLAALIVMMGLLGVLGFGAYRVSGPAQEWLTSAPQTVAEARDKLETFIRSVEQVREVVDDLGDGGTPTRSEPVTVQGSPLSDRLLAPLRARLVGGVAALFLLFFLLASGDRFLRKLTSVLNTFQDRRRLVEISRRIEADLSRYLLTTTAINIGLGVAVGLAMWWLQVPNPLLWGVLAAFLNYIPYLGGLVGVALIFLVSLVTFDTLGAAIAPPLAYLALNTLEAYMLTPAVMGQRFSLNPVMVFVSVFFWSWLWGVAGALMAVPLLTMIGIVCNRVDMLSPVARILER